MDINKVKIVNFILFVDFILYIFSNFIIFNYSPSSSYSIFALCIRDIIILLFSIFLYTYFCNSKVSSILLLPKINNKIIKNSIIIGISFYFIANGVNIIFRNIFRFTLKNTIYLNNMYESYNLGFGFIFYLVIYTVFVEIFFRGVLNDAFKFLSYRVKIIFTSLIFAVFLFGLPQIFYGFALGILLMSFFNVVGNIGPVIISSWVINIINYVVKLISKNFMDSNSGMLIFQSRDIFIDFLFPLIIILIGLIIYSIFLDKLKLKKSFDLKKSSNVTELNFKINLGSVVDIYFLLFLASIIFSLIFSYFFMG